MQYKIKTLFLLSAIIAVLLWGFLAVMAAIQPRVLASVDHPNGTRLRVTQCFNYRPELFTTSVYFDDGDGKWRWYYFDHQDSYWGNADTNIVDSKIYVTSKYRSVEFDTSTGECTTFRFGNQRFCEKLDTIKSLPAGTQNETRPQESARPQRSDKLLFPTGE